MSGSDMEIGRNRRIDIHAHIVPESFPAYSGADSNVPWPSMIDADGCHKHILIQGAVYRTVSEGCWSVPRRVGDMDETGIALQVISPMPELLSYWLPLDDAKAMTRYLNDQIAAMVDRAPTRLAGLGAVPLQDVESAIREMEYVVRKLNFAGVEIASHVNGTSIGHVAFEPFFAAAIELGAAIFVHALRPAGQERIVGAFPEQAVCFPGDIALAAASMITGGIGARHPGLRIAFSHGGGGLSMLLPRLMHAWKVVPKLHDSLIEAPVVTARRFFYDDLLLDPAAINFIISMFGRTQICIGTDYPFAFGDAAPVSTLQQCGLDEATLALIMSTNAKRFLRLS